MPARGFQRQRRKKRSFKRVWNFVKKQQRRGMGFCGIRRHKAQIERTAAGGFFAALAGEPRSEASLSRMADTGNMRSKIGG